MCVTKGFHIARTYIISLQSRMGVNIERYEWCLRDIHNMVFDRKKYHERKDFEDLFGRAGEGKKFRVYKK